MTSRAIYLSTAAKLHALTRLECADDAAIANRACALLAEYADQLECALGGAMWLPWEKEARP